jgi:hypothetical protein
VALIDGQLERCHPVAAGLAEQIADVGPRDQIAHLDRGHLVGIGIVLSTAGSIVSAVS